MSLNCLFVRLELLVCPTCCWVQTLVLVTGQQALFTAEPALQPHRTILSASVLIKLHENDYLSGRLSLCWVQNCLWAFSLETLNI